MAKDSGGEEMLDHALWGSALTRDLFKQMMRVNDMNGQLQDKLYGEGTAGYPSDAQVLSYAQDEKGVYRAKHILLKTVDTDKPITDEDGNSTTTEITETVLVIELTHKTPDEMAADYHFTIRQNTYLQLLQEPQYEELWAELLGGFAQGGGELMNPDSTRTPTGTLQWPLPVAGTITSQFGHRVDPITGEVSSHTGTDIACAEGTPILAAADGVVTVANGLDSWGGSYGYYIQIDHGGGLETLYAHCSSICVTTGQQVQAGQVIGYVGHTGRVTGSHLHLEVRIDGNRADAMQYFTL
mgnify:CR=1 FL=1